MNISFYDNNTYTCKIYVSGNSKIADSLLGLVLFHKLDM